MWVVVSGLVWSSAVVTGNALMYECIVDIFAETRHCKLCRDVVLLSYDVCKVVKPSIDTRLHEIHCCVIRRRRLDPLYSGVLNVPANRLLTLKSLCSVRSAYPG
jgi:hypothetical protein